MDPVGLVIELQVTQHHDSTEHKRSWVRKVLETMNKPSTVTYCIETLTEFSQKKKKTRACLESPPGVEAAFKCKSKQVLSKYIVKGAH